MCCSRSLNSPSQNMVKTNICNGLESTCAVPRPKPFDTWICVCSRSLNSPSQNMVKTNICNGPESTCAVPRPKPFDTWIFHPLRSSKVRLWSSRTRLGTPKGPFNVNYVSHGGHLYIHRPLVHGNIDPAPNNWPSARDPQIPRDRTTVQRIWTFFGGAITGEGLGTNGTFGAPCPAGQFW